MKVLLTILLPIFALYPTRAKIRYVSHTSPITLTTATSETATDSIEEAWVSIYNGPGNGSDWANDIVVDDNGNVYVTGSSLGLSGNYDCTTIKYDQKGDTLWVARYNGPANLSDWANVIAIDNNGYIYVSGGSIGLATDVDFITIKYNSFGAEQWIRKYNGPGNSEDIIVDNKIDPLGNVYVTGYSTGLSSNKDYTTIKYNSLGVEQWIRIYNGPLNHEDKPVAISVDDSSNAIITGNSLGLFWYYDYTTIKYNANGVEQWVRRYNSTTLHSSLAYDVSTDLQGNVYVTGASPDSGSTTSDFLTIKYNPSGELLWKARYNGIGNDSDLAYYIEVDLLGNSYITGYSQGEGNRVDYATVKYDSSGNELWVSRYDGGQVQDLAIDHLGNVYVTGVSSDSTTIGDYTTVKYDFNGVQEWVARFNGPGDGLDIGEALTVDDIGNVYVTGRVEVPGPPVTYDYATVKYIERIIPVELISFTAVANEFSVVLAWETATETNNYGFEIQRRLADVTQNTNYEKIGFITGSGTSTQTRFYSFIDNDIPSGSYAYRLKQIDFDGSFVYSSVVEATVGVPLVFSLEQNFPNPFNPVTTINYSIAEHSLVVLKIYNSLGEEVSVLVQEEKDGGRYSYLFDAQTLSSGVYFYRLNASEISGEYVSVKKFILLK